MDDEFAWAEAQALVLRDGLTRAEVIEALYARPSLRLDNRTPVGAPTFLAICGPTETLRLIVVVCTRPESFGPWTIIGARDASLNEYAMWRKHTA